jgi:hypothetical protein
MARTRHLNFVARELTTLFSHGSCVRGMINSGQQISRLDGRSHDRYCNIYTIILSTITSSYEQQPRGEDCDDKPAPLSLQQGVNLHFARDDLYSSLTGEYGLGHYRVPMDLCSTILHSAYITFMKLRSIFK